MFFWKIVLASVSFLGFMGCAQFNDDEGIFVNKADDYLDALDQRSLIIPDDLAGDRIQDPYPIPESKEQVNPAFYPNRPPQPRAMYANDARDEVRIQRLGGRRWLAVPESPDGVWPKVKQFLAENGVEVSKELGKAGRLDSEWLEIKNEAYRDVVRAVVQEARNEVVGSGVRDQILIRIERGLREKTAEVHLRHRSTNEINSQLKNDFIVDITTLQSSLEEVEAELLAEIGAFIAAKVSEQTVSMVAQQISVGAKSEVLRNEQGIPVLRLHLDEGRAWAAIGQALNRAEVDIKSSDLETGTYLVAIGDSFLISQERRGFFRRLFGSSGKKNKAASNDLQIVMEKDDDLIFSVYILDEDNEHIDRESSQDLLVMIREFSS
tara:strand:- start:100 stop:1236 length:1137 start_codon:yes stop_codon:yes gene_type:complete